MKSRLRGKTKTPFSIEDFYIFNCDNRIWQLRDRHTHMVVSTNATLEGILECAKKIIVRYKYKELYNRVMSKLSEVCCYPSVLAKRERELKEVGYLYDDQLEVVIEEYNTVGVKPRTPRVVVDKPLVSTERNQSASPSTPLPPVKRLKKRKSRLLNK